jgi:hydrogenase maturation protease
MSSGTLVAGIGNVFLGDDGFGVEVVTRLAGLEVPDGVRVADYGIRGMHLAYDLASGYDTAILVDAAPRGEVPGTVYVIEPDLSAGVAAAASLAVSPFFDAHGMQPDVVFGMLDTLDGGRPGRILVVGCEPASVDYGMGLSEPVSAAVDQAVSIVLDLVAAAGSQPADGRRGHQHSRSPVTGTPESGAGHLLAEDFGHVPRDSR